MPPLRRSGTSGMSRKLILEFHLFTLPFTESLPHCLVSSVCQIILFIRCQIDIHKPMNKGSEFPPDPEKSADCCTLVVANRLIFVV